MLNFNIVMKPLLTILLVVYSIVIFSANNNELHQSICNDSLNHKDSTKNYLYEIKKVIIPYGSYRITYGMNTDGYFGISDNASRFGVRAEMPLNTSIGLDIFALVEFGTNLVDKDDIIVFRTDPGAEFTQEGNAIYSRLGLIGISTKYFDFSVGKQWSVYYDVSSFTDQFYAFGADGSGTFNLNSDGGISGTGRANRVFMLRSVLWGPLKFGIQAQTRDITDNHKTFADTWGGSLLWDQEKGLSFGLAFNIVRDGVENPLFNQPKKNDKAFIAALQYKKKKFHMAFSVSKFTNHEKLDINDTISYYFSGTGLELFIGYDFTQNRNWRIATGFNYLQPEKGTLAGSYRLQYYIVELSYNFSKSSYIFTTAKINNSSEISGIIDTTSIFAMGLRFSFGY